MQGVANTSTSSTRNHGIDLLRIIAMLFVVVLHTLTHGGAYEATHGLGYASATTVYAFADCAVDAFVIISGYCMFNVQYRTKRIISLWLEAFFYSVVISACFAIFDLELLATQPIEGIFLPVLTKRWWFITMYFGTFFFMPFVNKAIHAISSRACILLLAIIAASCVASLFFGDIFAMSHGYSLVWFLALYAIGAVLKRLQTENHTQPQQNTKGPLFYFMIYAAICLANAVIIVFVNHELSSVKPATDIVARLLDYNSPLVIASAVALVIAFSMLRIRNAHAQKVIAFFSGSALAAYLISDHPLMRAAFMKGTFEFVGSANPFLIPLICLGTAALVFVACVLLDKARIVVFKLIRIDKLPTRLGDAIDEKVIETKA